jgi:hypothetical protein
MTNEQLYENLKWLVYHSLNRAIISKAKAAELLGIPLIDFKYEECGIVELDVTLSKWVTKQDFGAKNGK